MNKSKPVFIRYERLSPPQSHEFNEDVLLYCCERNKEKGARFLLNQNVNSHGDHELIFRTSASLGHYDIVRLLLDHGANIHAAGNEALHSSILNGHFDVAKLLIQSGVNANARSMDETPLTTSLKRPNIAFIQFLLDNGASVQEYNYQALRRAIEYQQLDIVQLLTRYVVDPSLPYISGILRDHKLMMQATSFIFPERRNFIFRGSPPYLGVELEIDFHKESDRVACLEALRAISVIQIAAEASVPFGFEIITDPMDIRHQLLVWRQILPIVAKHKGHCTQNCGVHIRIDRTKQTDINIPQIFNITNQSKLELIAKRQENKFCDYSNCAYKGKYTCVNIEKRTIEIRIFRCTIILKNMIGFLLFANDIMTQDEATIRKKHLDKLLK